MIRKAGMSLSLGGGVGVVYSDIRPSGTRIRKTNGVATGPLSPAQMLNEVARHIISGGNRRSAIWSGLHWWHSDIFNYIRCKDWSDEVKAQKEKDYSFPAPMDMTNISVILDDEFFDAYEDTKNLLHEHAHEVYEMTLEYMLSGAEPGFSVDVGENRNENLRNACTELVSEDDSDVCNLASINLSRIDSIEEFEEIVDLGTLFLLAGTVYSDIPHEEVRSTREKNRRLGLGLMGVHEWLLKRDYPYEVTEEFHEWLSVYEQSTPFAHRWADQHSLSRPIKTRAIAPNGTIGILAETTSGIEPIFCVAEKRRFLTAEGWRYQYVISPTADRLIQNEGVDPGDIEDAYSLAYNYEKRIAFQADMQEYVDHAISSTINLPYPITDPEEVKQFGETLYKYLPRLRGITCYPDGARAGQPLTAVPYEIAKDKIGVTYDEREDTCVGGICGI
jgi:ribonucleoside-diphosphate reductase alpha chain